MFIVFFFVLLLSNNLYKINSLSIINLLDNDKEYGDYEKFRKILVKRNKNNFAIEYIDSANVNTPDFGKIFTVNSIGCIDGQEYRICTDETGTIFYPFIRIELPAIN